MNLVEGKWYLIKKQGIEVVRKYTNDAEDAYYAHNLFGPDCSVLVVCGMFREDEELILAQEDDSTIEGLFSSKEAALEHFTAMDNASSKISLDNSECRGMLPNLIKSWEVKSTIVYDEASLADIGCINLESIGVIA